MFFFVTLSLFFLPILERHLLMYVLSWLCLRSLLVIQSKRKNFFLFCLVHMFIVVELPETDLKAVAAALD